MKGYKVFVTARSFASNSSKPLEYMNQNGCVVERIKPEELPVFAGEADGIIAGLESYTPEILKRFEKLKVISRYGVGYDRIDIETAREKGIAVTITPGANEDSVADLAMALMLCAARNLPFMDKSIKDRNQQRPIGLEMWGKTLGIVGTGRIGKGVIKRAKGFDMDILCVDQFPDAEFAEEYGATYTDMATLIESSDFITLHIPLTGATRNFIGKSQLERMKRNAVLVNTARGGIVDEKALYDALKERRIYAAALDATVIEPPYESPLLTLDNFVISPHIGATTYDAVDKMSMMAAQNLVEVLAKGSCRYCVNP